MKLHPEVTNTQAIKRFATLEEDFRKVHSDKYDYSESIYRTSKDSINIICTEHGLFTQLSAEHLAGKGCKDCAIQNTRSNTHEFIQKAILKHGEYYDYSQVDYKTSRDKIIIICPIHKEFTQRPDHHLEGKGCQHCSYKIPTNEAFIKQAQEIHGDRYDYSKVDYINRTQAITIICAEHNEFAQRPSDHLAGNGCPTCAGNIKKTTQQFIKDANIVHENKYDYSKVKYSTNRDKVVVTCPIHGDFEQTPTAHLSGSGCNRCGNNIRTNEEFILKANKVHNGKYDYLKTVFKDSREHIMITCCEHGDFLQIAGNHLLGKGCPGCSSGGFDSTKPGILYYLSINEGEAYKIGITNKSVEKRYSKSDREKIRVIRIWDFINGRDALKIETDIKQTYSYARYRGENLLVDGNTELFSHDILHLDTPNT